eukprot:PLAT9965.2.p2 GENE.PLAT9965.2~~PLAT9965.2.p2  ORF type:complete len:560 (+),score=296.57 PLAT9965.2:483-2162(+)
MGFVFQDDLLLPSLTVRETIWFSAQLRLPEKLGMDEKERRVDELIERLGLSHRSDALIGNEKARGVSGGERKRTAIGVELVTQPSILFLDEPTSGLDASTALSLVKLLRELAATGVAIVCSIHQPRSNIFDLFDHLLLLDGGQAVYDGRIRSVIPYFHRIGFPVPPLTNAADFLMDVVTSGELAKVPTTGNEQAPVVEEAGEAAGATGEEDAAGEEKEKETEEEQFEEASLVEAFATLSARAGSKLGRHGGSDGDGEEDEAAAAKRMAVMRAEMEAEGRWATSFSFQLWILMQRSWRQSRGDAFNRINFTQKMIVAFFASLLWWQSDNLLDRIGALFFVLIQQSFDLLTATVRVFPPERSLFMRERSTGSYHVGAYFLAKTMNDLFFTITLPTLYATIVYFAIGFVPDAAVFFSFLGIFLSVVISAQSLGLLFTCLISDIATVSVFTPIAMLIVMLSAGFYVQAENMPPVADILKGFSFLYWGFASVLVNQFEGRSFSCDMARDGEYGEACPIDGDTIIAARGVTSTDVGVNLAVLWTQTILFRVIAYLLLRFKAKLRV